MTQPAVHRGHPYFTGYFWDHYTEHPDVYDGFALSTDAGMTALAGMRDLSGISVLDVASGTGRSAFAAVAAGARLVVGVEPDARMRQFAERRRAELQAENVTFLEGATYAMPELAAGSFDLVTAFHGPPFRPRDIPEFVGVLAQLLSPGGAIAIQWTTPQWRHEYHRTGPPGTEGPISDPNRRMEAAFVEAGFTYEDELVYADHGSLENALATYGFIYGPAAIDWLLDGRHSRVPWSLRTYLLTV